CTLKWSFVPIHKLKKKGFARLASANPHQTFTRLTSRPGVCPANLRRNRMASRNVLEQVTAKVTCESEIAADNAQDRERISEPDCVSQNKEFHTLRRWSLRLKPSSALDGLSRNDQRRKVWNSLFCETQSGSLIRSRSCALSAAI